MCKRETSESLLEKLENMGVVYLTFDYCLKLSKSVNIMVIPDRIFH